MAVTPADNLPPDPHHHVGFVSISPVRGTMELVWGCVFTIIICTWNIQHLSIESPYKPAWWCRGRKLFWALVTVLAPEYISMQAMEDYHNARVETQVMQRHGYTWWTMKHSFFGEIGGYLLEYQNEGKVLVTSTEIRWLATQKLLDMSEIKSSEIDGLASADTFQKAIAAVQLLWFALQCVGRAVGRMEFALFEVTTLCFVSFTIVSLFCWWKKPSGVSIRRNITCPLISAQDIDKMLARTGGNRSYLMWDLHIPQEGTKDRAIPWDWLLYFLAGGVGAWHLAAWNYPFPTSVESILWRASSIFTTISPGMIYLLTCVNERFPQIQSVKYTIPFLFVVYAVARIFLVVETIISLRSAPAGIYERVSWSSYLPHV